MVEEDSLQSLHPPRTMAAAMLEQAAVRWAEGRSNVWGLHRVFRRRAAAANRAGFWGKAHTHTHEGENVRERGPIELSSGDG